MFVVGQNVLCVDDQLWEVDQKILPNKPVAGCVYTVRSIQIDADLQGYGIRLVEIVNPVCHFLDTDLHIEWSFMSIRFRPVVDTKQEKELVLATRPTKAGEI